mgnify:CR=1 FL=1
MTGSLPYFSVLPLSWRQWSRPLSAGNTVRYPPAAVPACTSWHTGSPNRRDSSFLTNDRTHTHFRMAFQCQLFQRCTAGKLQSQLQAHPIDRLSCFQIQRGSAGRNAQKICRIRFAIEGVRCSAADVKRQKRRTAEFQFLCRIQAARTCPIWCEVTCSGTPVTAAIPRAFQVL